MSLQTRIAALISAVGGDIKTLTNRIGTLSGLNTSNKTNLVAAINEVKAVADAASGTTPGATINDTAASTATVYSSTKTLSEINAAITALVNGAPGTFDTLKEIADELANTDTALDGLLTSVANRVRYDAAQALTTAQQKQASENIGVGDPEVDLVALYTTAKA